jgi:hypothetical protein
MERFGIEPFHKGKLSGLQERAAKHAGMVSAFCERLGWVDLEMLVTKFQSERECENSLPSPRSLHPIHSLHPSFHSPHSLTSSPIT